LPVVFGLALLATLPALGGCSSSNRRDQFYGTDAGADYQIPDAAVFSNSTGEDADVVEAAADAVGTAADADGTAADADGTAADADGTAADAVGTAADAVETAADAEARDATADASAEESDSGFDS
jgi:hypothetical protein